MKTARRVGFFSLLLPLALLFTGHALMASDPLVTLSTMELKFGTQALGTSSSPAMVVLTNIGQADLLISSIEIGGENNGDFTETTDCAIAPAVLPAGSGCAIRVIFHPRTSESELTATLAISDSAVGSPRHVALHGVPSAAAPGVTLAPPSVGFAKQATGSSSPAHAILLTNSGSVVLDITSAISLSGADSGQFRLQETANGCPADSGQVAPRASCEISVVFAPTTPGAKSAQIAIIDDAAGSPHVVPLSGMAVAP